MLVYFSTAYLPFQSCKAQSYNSNIILPYLHCCLYINHIAHTNTIALCYIFPLSVLHNSAFIFQGNHTEKKSLGPNEATMKYNLLYSTYACLCSKGCCQHCTRVDHAPHIMCEIATERFPYSNVWKDNFCYISEQSEIRSWAHCACPHKNVV